MKVSPIVRLLQMQPAMPWQLVHTGQHYDAGMSDSFFEQLSIPPPHAHLHVGSASHGVQTGKILIAFEQWLLDQPARPRGVVVVGDVNSTLACALAATKLGIPVAHVEAGLRSFDRTMPEEINRLLTDAISNVLLVSEPSGVANLRREGVAEDRIFLVGNVMIDTLVQQLDSARSADLTVSMGMTPGTFALVTLHRPSNVDERGRLGDIVSFLEWLGTHLPAVFPLHPRTRDRLQKYGLLGRLLTSKGLQLVEPLGYRENISLMASAKLVLTDSGGIQEETSYLGIPCLTLRPNTERPVTVEMGSNILVGENLENARIEVQRILEGNVKRGVPIPLWDGHTAERIIAILTKQWSI
jgi:UDP-N-acetylglucosamine 2-epimerase (non-hydrolysing)